MNLKILQIIICFVFGGSLKVYSQNFYLKAKKEVFASATVSNNGINPFWLRSNTYGTVPLASNYGTIGAKLTYDYDSTFTLKKKLNRFSWGYGLDILANINSETRVYLPEVYGKIRYQGFELYLGKRREIFGLLDSTLSSGSFSWSGNAMSLPKIQLSAPNYIRINRLNILSIKGGYAHGYFDNDRQYTQNVKLHQKWMYFQIGKPQWKINLNAGFNHQVMWGGQSPFYATNGELPDGLKHYKYVVLGTRNPKVDSTINDFEENRIGNHIGSVDVGLTIKTSFGVIQIYRQNIYEDGSLFYLTNIKDGLNGIIINTKVQSISKICFEYLNTTNQGGDAFFIDREYLRGKDNYYLNSQYLDGYTNRNYVVGSPLLQVNSLNWMSKEEEIQFYKNNNRVKAFHLGVTGFHKNVSYQLKGTHSKNYGTYSEYFDKSQSSFMYKIALTMDKKRFISAIELTGANDIGNLYPNSFASTVKLVKKM